jgi:hypothetical protein
MALFMIVLFGSAWLAMGPAVGSLTKPFGWIMAAQIGMPWIGVLMAWCFPRWYTVFAGRDRYSGTLGDQRIGLVWFFFFTFFTPTMYYAFATLVRRTPMLPLACLVGAALLVGGGLRDPYLWAGDVRRHPYTLVIAVILSSVYGYATILQLNVVLDRSEDTVFQSRVSAKFHTRGKWSLEVAAWTPEQESQRVSVPYELYNAVRPGDPVCIVQRNGALGIPWYTAQPCPWKGGPVYLEVGGSL